MIKIFIAIALATADPLPGQWMHVAIPGTPRTSDGKPNLSAPAPRSPDGKPDLSGIWVRPMREAEHMRNLAADVADISLKPWAEALYAQRIANGGAGRPSERCLPDTVPDGLLLGTPFKIIQTPGVTIILYEQMNHYRQVFTDGREFPAILEPTWLGYSVAKWEGDRLVAETRGLRAETWLDTNGHPHSDAFRLTERFRRLDFGHMQIEFTIDDPKAYEKPWSGTVRFDLIPDTELIENICENEKDAQHILGN